MEFPKTCTDKGYTSEEIEDFDNQRHIEMGNLIGAKVATRRRYIVIIGDKEKMSEEEIKEATREVESLIITNLAVIGRIQRMAQIIHPQEDTESVNAKMAEFHTWFQKQFPNREWSSLNDDDKDRILTHVGLLGGEITTLGRNMKGRWFSINSLDILFNYVRNAFEKGNNSMTIRLAQESFEKGGYTSSHCRY